MSLPRQTRFPSCPSRLGHVGRPCRRAFTLVELLTVIGIVGVLAAILIPTTVAVRESGKRTACLGQMRQLGMGLLAYINNNPRRVGPYSGRDAGNSDPSLWRYKGQLVQLGLLSPYLDFSETAPKTPGIFICPGTPSPRAETVKGSSDLTSYWLNPTFSSEPSRMPNLLDQPNQRVAIADYCAWWNTSLWPDFINHGASGMNVFRIDGSAQWLPSSKTTGLPAWDWSKLDKL